MIAEALLLVAVGAGVFTSASAGVCGFLFGKKTGVKEERDAWLKLRDIAIPGQRISIKFMGEVFVLGYSDDEEYVDVIHMDFLEDPADPSKFLWPSEIDQEILEKNTISIKTKQFLTQVPEQSYKKAAAS